MLQNQIELNRARLKSYKKKSGFPSTARGSNNSAPTYLQSNCLGAFRPSDHCRTFSQPPEMPGGTRF